jgi:hypothetical protein
MKRLIIPLIQIVLALALVQGASAATLGLHFQTGADVGGTNGAHLAPTDVAGAPVYAQANWNNLAGAMGTNVAVIDSSGANSGVSVNWACANTWSQSGNSTASQGTPDLNLMNPYLDNNGNANVAISGTYNMFSTTTPANNNRNWPMIYLTNLTAWVASQSGTAYDIVIYFDTDNVTGGRTGEYWPVNASGDATALTLAGDAATHVFGCDLNNFIANPVYNEVPGAPQASAFPNVSGGLATEFGNGAGNFLVLRSLTNDTVLLRTQRFNSRAVINAIQIVPRATVLPATFYALTDLNVFAGGKARFAPIVAGGTPMTFGWQKNGVALSDGGSIAGSSTATLTITGVSAGDAASYSLVVTNSLGVVTSAPAALTLYSPVPNSFPEKILTNSPYAYWRFNDMQDASTNFAVAVDTVGGFHAIYGRAAQNRFNGTFGPQPGDFPGFESGNPSLLSANNVRLTYALAPPLNLNTNTATFCAWIYPTGPQNGFCALIAARNGNDVADFGFGNNSMLGYTWNSNSAATYNFTFGSAGYPVPLQPPSNMWSFVALTISPTNGILYLYNTNGQLSATNSIAHTNEGWSGLTFLGCDGQGASINTPQGRSFAGYIDELAVFNRTLPQTEVYNLYKKGLGLNAIGPTIPNQPQSLALFAGRPATFSITASGDQPLTYQWRTNGVNLSNGGTVSGANTPTLSISSVGLSDAANYDVVVGNLVGPITSSVVSLTVIVSNNVPTPYEAKLRAANPIAYWRLNETNGSPYSYDYWGGIIATNENVNLGVPGPVPPDYTGLESTNTGGSYDGFTSDTATSVSLMNNRSQFTIFGWFNAAGTIGTRVGLFGQNDVCEFGFHGLGPDGQAQLGIWTPSAAAFLNQSTNVIPGVWYLVACVGTGTNVNLYLVSTNGGGGFQVAQATTSGTTTNYGVSSFPFRIGGGGILDPTGNYFTGLIDEVAVFNRALSASELSDIFGAALLGGDLPPSITLQPTSATLYAGRTEVLSVSAVGTSPTYIWRKNGVPFSDGGNVIGTTTPTVTITNIGSANAGSYDVVITNRVGSVTSVVAVVTVITPVPNSYESAVIAGNPFAYYRLNETNDPSSGTAPAFDFWGGHSGLYAVAAQNGFNGIAGPRPPTYNGFDSGNFAMQTFPDTANSYATAPVGSVGTNTVTFTAWLYPTGPQPVWAGLLVNRGGGVSGGFNMNDQQMLGYTWNNNNANTWGFASGLVVPSNQWSFVAVSIGPSNAVLYLINANTLASATNTVTHTSDVFGNNWRIGHDAQDGAAATTRVFNGIMDEVALYLRTLSLSEIEQLYVAGGFPLPVTLTIQPAGPGVIVTWPQGTLMEATNVLGPWKTNNASSPYTNSASGDNKFYRVIVR